MQGEYVHKSAMIVIALATSVAGSVAAGPGPKGHTHATFNAGVPGDPKRPFRVVEVIATEAATGAMSFAPGRLVVQRGEQVKFVIRNVGKMDHEFMLDSVAANSKHALVMIQHPEMEHDDPNGKRIAVSQSAEIIWKFTKLGTFEYACLLPGHYEAGMKGVVEVVEAAAKSKLR